MSIELYNQGGHRCLMFTDLCDGAGERCSPTSSWSSMTAPGAVIDPGGNMAYNELYLSMTRYFPPSGLAALIASTPTGHHRQPGPLDHRHAGQDLHQHGVERFIPALLQPERRRPAASSASPTPACAIPIGSSTLIALPAHFLHAEGNFQFYDPIARILFSGDLGVSMVSSKGATTPVTSLAPLLPRMEAFHRRYMVSNKVLGLWADMVAPLPIDMMVPQHGAPLMGPAVREFINWARQLQCGIDLMGTDRPGSLATMAGE